MTVEPALLVGVETVSPPCNVKVPLFVKVVTVRFLPERLSWPPAWIVRVPTVVTLPSTGVFPAPISGLETLSPDLGTKPRFQLAAVSQSVDTLPSQVRLAAPAQLMLTFPPPSVQLGTDHWRPVAASMRVGSK